MHTHWTESISGRQLPPSETRGRREVRCVPETPSCTTRSDSPAGSPVTSYNEEAWFPHLRDKKGMVLSPANWLAEEARGGWVNKRKEERCGKLCAQALILLCVPFFPLCRSDASWQAQEHLTNLLIMMIHPLISRINTKADPRIHIHPLFIRSSIHPANDYQWA